MYVGLLQSGEGLGFKSSLTSPEQEALCPQMAFRLGPQLRPSPGSPAAGFGLASLHERRSRAPKIT